LRRAVAAATAKTIAKTLGLDLNDTVADVPAEIQAMADERQTARTQKDFAKADELRDRLAEAGWAIEDSADGQLIKPIG